MTTKRRPKLPAPPRHLGVDAAAIWRQVVAYLRDNDRLEAVDAGTIETYALAVVRQRGLQAALDRDGMVIDGALHPAARTIEAVAATVRSAAHCLGLTPASRKALPAKAKTKEPSVWSGVLDD